MKTSPGFGFPAAALAAATLLIASCGKEETKPAEPAKAPDARTVAAPKPPPEKKPLPVAPQGKLPKMDPEQAKFIASPSTPKDKDKEPDVNKIEVTKKGEVKAVDAKMPPPMSVPEIKKPEEAKKAEVKATEVQAAVPAPAPEIKKTAPAQVSTPAEAPVAIKAAEVRPAEVIAKSVPTTSPPPEVKKAEVK